MTKRILAYIGAFSIASAMLLAPLTALAASPQLSVSAGNNNSLNFTVSGADQFAMINFYARQSGGTWTTITNAGRTDQSGYYNGNLYPGYVLSAGSVDAYVSVNGQNSPTMTVGGNNNGCDFYSNCSSILQASQTNVTLNSGASTIVTFYPNYYGGGNQSLFISSALNSSVATASLSGNSLFIYGTGNGSTSVQVCAQYSQCATVYITVNGYNGGSITLSNTSPSVSQGQNTSVYVTSNNNTNGVYVSTNSNPSVVSPTVSGSTITLYGNAVGNSTVVVCANNGTANCATMYVTVSGNNTSGFITPTTLSQPFLNQFYSVQLYVTSIVYSPVNNNIPVNCSASFSVVSGSLPPGLNLSSCGLISGIPTNGGTYNFTVQGANNYASGTMVRQSYTVTVSGSVLGLSTYTNGTLLGDGGTIYIIYRNSKLPFTNWPAFAGHGFRLENVTYASGSNISTSSYYISTSSDFHPWGTWIKSGNTVYLMHENGLVPISSYDIFLNNGGQDRLVVPAKSMDFLRPMLSMMEYNDFRLR